MLWKGRLKKNPTIQGWFPKSYVSKELRIEKKQVLPTDSKINSPTSKSSIAITRGNSLTKITQENFISEVRKSKTTDSFSPLSTAKKSNEETAPTNPTHQKELNGNANGQQKNEERADEGKESDGSWYIALYNFEPVEDDGKVKYTVINKIINHQTCHYKWEAGFLSKIVTLRMKSGGEAHGTESVFNLKF